MSHQARKAPLTLVEKSFPKGKSEVSLSAFAFLFSEIVQYCRKNCGGIDEWEERLSSIGFQVGCRIHDLCSYREKIIKRETTIVGMLTYVTSIVWKAVFGHVADGLEKSTEADGQYWISDNSLLTNRYISVPKEFGRLHCGAFVAGLVRGVLDTAEFPARVTAHFVSGDPASPIGPTKSSARSIIFVHFEQHVVERDRRLASSK